MDRLSGDNRKLIADNQEMKARFELGRTALAKYVALPSLFSLRDADPHLTISLGAFSEVAQQKEKASHHEIELKRRIEEVRSSACANAQLQVRMNLLHVKIPFLCRSKNGPLLRPRAITVAYRRWMRSGMSFGGICTNPSTPFPRFRARPHGYLR